MAHKQPHYTLERTSTDDMSGLVNIVGASLDTLRSPQGEVLQPVYADAGKRRGGMHVCLPNFGPDFPGSDKKHGFGRDVVWSPQPTPNTYAYNYLHNAEQVLYIIRYDLASSTRTGSSELKAILSATNLGNVAVRLTPGFHPYFAINPTDVLRTPAIRNMRINEYELRHACSRRVEAHEPIDIKIGRQAVSITHDGSLPEFYFWSDGQTTCIEPTAYGARCGENDKPKEDEMLERAMTRSFSFTITARES